MGALDKIIGQFAMVAVLSGFRCEWMMLADTEESAWTTRADKVPIDLIGRQAAGRRRSAHAET
ncbi:MAG: hypothetical protein M3N26_09730 [Pseudomonadota bacterium]|nr:hypothetical protein [Pseudomonadota bacterium]